MRNVKPHPLSMVLILFKNFTSTSRKGLLKSLTLFCTFDIRNLYTMLPQEEALDILVEFLRVHGYTHVKSISLDIIRQLASIVLKENVFVYGEEYLQTNDGWSHGITIYFNLDEYFHVEMAKRTCSPTRYDGRILRSVSTEKRIR